VDLEDVVGADEHVGSLFGPTKAWAWVKKIDVLSRRLQRGFLSSGFTERDISFPPSFKWRMGATADDYTRGARSCLYDGSPELLSRRELQQQQQQYHHHVRLLDPLLY